MSLRIVQMTNGSYCVRGFSEPGIWAKGLLESGNCIYVSESRHDCECYVNEQYTGLMSYNFSDIIQDNEVAEYNSKIKELVHNNEDLPIVFTSDTNCYDKNFLYFSVVKECKIQEIVNEDSRVCCNKSALEEKLKFELLGKYPDVSEELIQRLTDEAMNRYIWRKVITIRVD